MFIKKTPSLLSSINGLLKQKIYLRLIVLKLTSFYASSSYFVESF